MSCVDKKTPRKARILKDGVLTLATWGADESLTWLKRIGGFQCAVRYAFCLQQNGASQTDFRHCQVKFAMVCLEHGECTEMSKPLLKCHSCLQFLNVQPHLILPFAGASWGIGSPDRHPGADPCWTLLSGHSW